jgi:hypothetical protein
MFFYWAADESNFEMGRGLPKEWRDEGAVFCGWAELRYWKRSGGGYEAVLILDQEAPPGILPPEEWTALPGDWAGDCKSRIFLQDLHEPRVNPRFFHYPNGSAGGMMEARMVYRGEVAVWVSLRGFAGGG